VGESPGCCRFGPVSNVVLVHLPGSVSVVVLGGASRAWPAGRYRWRVSRPNVMTVLVPNQRIAAAVDGAAGLQAAIFRAGQHLTLSDAEALAAGAAEGKPADDAPMVAPHRPPARAIVADQHTWAELEPIFAAVPTLELIQTLSAGVEFLRGVPASIPVANASGAHGEATAELAMTLLLSLWRKILTFLRDQDGGRWEWDVRSKSLVGAQFLTVGAGDLAVELARRAEAFGARVTMTARTARPGVQSIADLPSLLPPADAVVLMVPLNPATRGMVDAGFLAAMKDGATLINVARGPVVDTAALLAELKAGRLMAGLDVTDPEPLPPGHPLWTAPGVLITPHVGGATPGVGGRAMAVAVAQLQMLARGERPTNLLPRQDLD